MGDLFEGLFSRTTLGETCFMWWDVLMGYHGSDDNPSSLAPPAERLRVREADFRVLLHVLDLPQRHCQWSALHGLFHVRFPSVGAAPLTQPDTERAFQNFLRRDDLDAETRDYALACLAGDSQ